MIELSILIPAVFERRSWLLYDSLLKMIGDKPVEVLALFDNKKRTLGAKRNALMAAAQGRYVAHLDDDDWFIDPFVDEVLKAIAENPGADLIAYDQSATLDGDFPFRVSTDIANRNEDTRKVDGIWQPIRRKPWVWCTWRRELVASVPFPDRTNAEDWLWLREVLPLIKTQVKIDRVLHVYCFDGRKSVARGRP